MASLFFKDKRNKNQIGTFEIDVTVEENHSMTSQVTDNPVEGGSTINDHIINDPKQITLTGVVSNTPIAIFGIGSSESRTQDAFEALEELRDSRITFDLLTGFKLYRNCAFTDLQMPKVRAGVLRFSAAFKQLTIVRTELATIPADAVEDPELASGTDAGRQQTTAASDAQDEQARSILARAIGIGG